MIESKPTSEDAFDPLVLQAEKILNQRLARYQVIDPELLGEPGWDILLSVFIETGKGRASVIELIGEQLNLSVEITRRWVTLLVQRDMLETGGHQVMLTQSAEETLRKLFSAQLKEILRELSQHVAQPQSGS